MRLQFLSVIALFLFMPVAHAGDSERIEQLLDALSHAFESDPEQMGGEEQALRQRMVRVSAPAMGRYTAYLQVDRAGNDQPYRQRLLVYTESEDGQRIEQQTWAFTDPSGVADAFDRPAAFEALDETQLQAVLPDCVQTWREEGEGWRSEVDPSACRIYSERRQAWRRIGAESRLQGDVLELAERGYDDEGVLLWGTPEGEFHRLTRVTD